MLFLFLCTIGFGKQIHGAQKQRTVFNVSLNMQQRHLIFTGFLLLLFSCSVGRNAGTANFVPASKALYAEIRLQDSLMFAAFNAHDSRKLMEHFTADLEFYHDKGGLSDFTQTGQGFAQLFSQNETTGLRRELVPGSLEVYPIGEYGAVETCLHRFCHEENGKQDCGTFKNVMIWKKSPDGWKVSRVISYDH